jgi:4-hydroxyphenylacetate 3-monooxygenase
MSPSGSMADLARKVCGIENVSDDGETAYKAQADYARRQDAN